MQRRNASTTDCGYCSKHVGARAVGASILAAGIAIGGIGRALLLLVG